MLTKNQLNEAFKMLAEFGLFKIFVISTNNNK